MIRFQRHGLDGATVLPLKRGCARCVTEPTAASRFPRMRHLARLLPSERIASAHRRVRMVTARRGRQCADRSVASASTTRQSTSTRTGKSIAGSALNRPKRKRRTRRCKFCSRSTPPFPVVVCRLQYDVLLSRVRGFSKDIQSGRWGYPCTRCYVVGGFLSFVLMRRIAVIGHRSSLTWPAW